VKLAAALSSIGLGLLGVGTVLVFPSVALVLGIFALALGIYGRHGFSSYRTAATIGLLLGTIAMVSVLLVVVFFSDLEPCCPIRR
jgi:hypothetical protein